MNRLAVIGDTRADRSHLGPSARWPSLAWSITHGGSSALLHLGDWVKNGSNLNEWSAVKESLKLLRGLPIYTVKGNHDRGGFEHFFFGSDTHPALRSLQFGSILLYLIDSEASDESVKGDVEKLLRRQGSKEEDAQREISHKNVQAKIWVQHRPVWSSGPHGVDERGWRTWLVPALERLNIDLMLSGHDHQYERFCSSLGVDTQRRCDSHGVTYLISGGGASVTVPLPGLGWNQWALHREQNRSQRKAYSDAAHHLELFVQGDALVVEAWSSAYVGERALFDRFTILLSDHKR